MSEKEILEDFEKKVQLLYEVEVGDFKRKILLYINRLEEDLKKDIYQNILDQMREILICNKTVDIEILREDLINKIKDLYDLSMKSI